MFAAHRRTALNVLAICFLLGLASRGLNETFVVFVLPLSQSFGWTAARSPRSIRWRCWPMGSPGRSSDGCSTARGRAASMLSACC
ncbi:MAG: hypothetical protein WDO24_29280 [Pseudomonadota bacterium]